MFDLDFAVIRKLRRAMFSSSIDHATRPQKANGDSDWRFEPDGAVAAGSARVRNGGRVRTTHKNYSVEKSTE
jgi:hypothetical protein